MQTAEAVWQQRHPRHNFEERVILEAWDMLLPNLQAGLIDPGEFLNNLSVREDDELVWITITGKSVVLLPRVLYNLHKRNMLYGLRDLLIGHHERFRPLRMLSPEADDILVPGQQVTIRWSTVPRIGRMLEQQCGTRLQDAKLEIGLLIPGQSMARMPFEANISAATPFYDPCVGNGNDIGGSFTWTVPEQLMPHGVLNGDFWISARLLTLDDAIGQYVPYNTTGDPRQLRPVEAAGPPQGGFQIINTVATTAPQ